MNIYCPNCETPCSETADTCPKCGHPLAEPKFSLITLQGKPIWIAATLFAGISAACIALFLRQRAPPVAVAPSIVTAPLAPQRPYRLPTPQPPNLVAPISETGIGWSLRDVEAAWGPEHGWYWANKSRARIGLGIDYRAENAAYPHLAYRVVGPPNDLSSFTALVTFDTTTASEEQFLAKISLPNIMTNAIVATDAHELGTWTGELVRKFIEGGTSALAETRTYGHHTITLRVSITSNAIYLTSCVERAQSNADPGG